MTDPIQTQIRDYAHDVVAESLPVDLTKVMREDPAVRPLTMETNVEPDEQRTRFNVRRHRGGLVAAAAAAIVLIVLGGVAWLAPLGGGAPPATEPTVTTTTITIDATTKVTVVEGVPYRQPSDDDPSTVDIYLADTPSGPAVVLLHGWGRPGGTEPATDLAPLAEEIAKLGSTVFYFGWATNGGISADSAADLSCIGGFVSARAAEYGSDPGSVVVVGHSMGGETGSMLALSSFGLTPDADCVELGEAPTPYAFLGIGGSYGLLAQPLDDDLTMFRTRAQPADPIRELAAEEFVTPGLTALSAYALDGNSALPSANPLRMVLLVGRNDQYSVTNASITAAFAEALETSGTEVKVVEVPGANHDDVVNPDTDAGQTTLQVVRDLLDNTP